MSTVQKRWIQQTCDRCKTIVLEAVVEDGIAFENHLFPNPRRNDNDGFVYRDRYAITDLCRSCLADCLREWLAEMSS